MIGITGDYSDFNAQLIIDTVVSTALLLSITAVVILLAIRRGLIRHQLCS